MEQNQIDKLKQLGELHKQGILTKEEFEVEKQKIFSDNNSILGSDRSDKQKTPISNEPNNRDLGNKPPNSETTKDSKNLDSGASKMNSIPTKKRLFYIIPSIIILIGIGIFIGLYQHHQTEVAQQREQARLDSIAEVERLREIRRQDSIAEVKRKEIHRQDSIARIKAMKISPEKLLKFKTFNDGEKYFLITDNLENYLQAIGYDLINKSTYYTQDGTDGTGPLTKHFKYTYKKGNSVVEYNKGDIKFTMQSEKDAEEFIEKCLNMGFKFSHYSNNGYKVYHFSTAWCEIFHKGSEIIIGFAP